MKLVACLLIVVFIAGLAGSYFFWPSNKDQRPMAFFSLLQFVAAFAVVLLTFLYVTATQTILKATKQQLSDQNREPKISVISHYCPQVVPFSLNFQIEIANPSMRATSLSITSIQIGKVAAQDVYFEVDHGRTSRITVPARDIYRAY